jgi:pathogenesis-related protein 1
MVCLTVGLANSNMFALKWDDNLAKLAQGHAEKCYTEHTNMKLPSGIGTGQNLAMGYTVVDAAMRGWYGEKANFNHNTFKCVANKVCGNYTQIINAESQYVGCAFKVNSMIRGC